MKYTKKYQETSKLSAVNRKSSYDNWSMDSYLSHLNPYNYTRPSGTSPLGAFFSGNISRIPEVPSSVSRGDAFRSMRDKLGAGKSFLYKGVRYTTDHAGETEHIGTNFFFANMEKAVKDKSKKITQEKLDNFKTLWTELGQPDLEMGTDKYDNILTGKSWDELGLDRSDHVNPFTDKVWIKSYKTEHPDQWMDAILNELTHVKQQRDMGRVNYMGKYVSDLIGTLGDQGALYSKEGTLEEGAHNKLYDNMKRFVETGKRSNEKKYGGYIDTGNLKRKYQETSSDWKPPNLDFLNVQNYIDSDNLGPNSHYATSIENSEQAHILSQQAFNRNHIQLSDGRYVKKPEQATVSAQKDIGWWKPITNTLANPLAAFGYSARNQDVPYGRIQADENALDMAIGIFNPFKWGEYAGLAYDDIKEGNYLSAGLNLLAASPAVPSAIAGAKHVIPKISGVSKSGQIYNSTAKQWVKPTKPITEIRLKQDIASREVMGLNAEASKQASIKELNILKTKRNKLVTDHNMKGFDTPALRNDATMDAWVQHIKLTKGVKEQKALIKQYTDDIIELNNLPDDYFNLYLDEINISGKTDEIIKAINAERNILDRVFNTSTKGLQTDLSGMMEYNLKYGNETYERIKQMRQRGAFKYLND